MIEWLGMRMTETRVMEHEEILTSSIKVVFGNLVLCYRCYLRTLERQMSS